jgi:hypothetical protein
MTNYESSWHGEPQDRREVFAISLARIPFGTLRLLYRCPLFGLIAVVCVLGAKDLAAGRSLFDLGQFWGAVVFALDFIGAVFAFLAISTWVASYWNLNLVSQWFTLYGTAAVIIYLRAHGASVGDMAGRLIIATIGSFTFEIGSILWLIRRRDSERLHRLKQVSQMVGILSAVVVVIACVFWAA